MLFNLEKKEVIEIKEIWKDTEYIGYQVSNFGNVRSIDRYQRNSDNKIYHYKSKKLSLTKNSSGYLVVNLRQKGKSNVVTVHSLVAKAFLDNPNKFPVINHKDGNKEKNIVSNLEYTTYAENNIHALNNNLRKSRGVKIAQYDLNDNLIKIYESVSSAARQTNIGRSSISNCINGRAIYTGNFKWKRLSSQSTIESIE